MTEFQIITLALAAVGAVLGVINTWHALNNSRVKLVVRPMHAVPVGGLNSNIAFCIEVTNLSNFPVTVSEVGVFYHGTKARGAITNPILADGGAWPRRLEPRSSVTVYSQNPAVGAHPIKCAYATTECRVTQRATSPALKQLAKGQA